MHNGNSWRTIPLASGAGATVVSGVGQWVVLLAIVARFFTPHIYAQDAASILRYDGSGLRARLGAAEQPYSASRWSQELRSPHFAVVGDTDWEHAMRIAEEAETIWEEFSHLADHWTDAHHDPSFGLGAVRIVVMGEHTGAPCHQLPDLRGMNRPATVHVPLTGESSDSGQFKGRLRRDLALAFFRAAGHDRQLPEWVQLGVAEYFSGTPVPARSVGSADPRESSALLPDGPWTPRSVVNEMTRASIDESEARLWVRFLLEGNDSRYAQQFFDAMAETLAEAAGGGQRSLPALGTNTPGGVDSWQPESALDRLTESETVKRDMSRWLDDPNIGHPIVRTIPAQMPLDERHREMVLILKLAQRSLAPSDAEPGPKVYEFSREDREARMLPVGQRVASFEVTGLYRRLTDSSHTPWATIDTDGSLLMSTDRQRLDRVFNRADCRYRTHNREGCTVLEATFDSGEVFEAWIEPNEQSSQRPVVYVRQQPPTAARFSRGLAR
jgi:hypothetical protein